MRQACFPALLTFYNLAGMGILCSNESNEADTVWTMSSDQYPYHHILAESQSTLAVDGYVWALADVTPKLWCAALNPPTSQVYLLLRMK